ncbi:putative glucuronoxylan glucuronosyltransferase F8H isoform X2 [Tasmannia lanceolata]|uniref:putative glucuronoxylan glucuronosyltransferase F8H isoform X2 n=1 Tax=Tasmannia lanceolata TaxID=3420 RepID=UPI004063080C
MLYIKRSSKTKGLNPKMKLRRNDKTLCYKYFRWFLWFSLFIYFFSSYLISPFNKTIILPKTTVSQSQTNFISRALIETLSNATDSFHGSVQRDLKIYIYELPSEYNRDWLRNERCSNHLFGAEVAIHEALMRSDVRTFVPSEADFFFVPVYVSCNFSTVNGFPAIGHARRILASAVHFISSQMPFWNRSSGSDHVFVASHDFGACFHTMEDVAISDGIPSFLKKSIILQTFGVKSRHPCQEVENVLIPPYISPESVRSTLEAAAGNGERDIWGSENGYLEQIQSQPEVLHQAEEVYWLPVRDRTVSVLSVSSWVGPMEPKTGGVGCLRVRAGHNRRRHSASVPGIRSVARNLSPSRRERRREA